MRDLVINFSTDVYSGWGSVGVNWAGLLEPEYTPIFGTVPTVQHFVGVDPIRYSTLDRAIRRSRDWKYHKDCIVVDPVGNDLKGAANLAEHPACFIGRTIIEKADLREALDRLSKFDALLTGSTWCQERLESATGRKVKVIFEGVDPGIFTPGERSGWSRTFNIFSSGKVEFRKAQDVVLMAFKVFSQRHSDARLITLWNSPFADLGNGYKGIADEPMWLNEHGLLDIKRWAKDNGIVPERVLDLGMLPNPVVPQVLRECDVMLSPTRVESCTSLPVKEAMACGLPVIAGYHSGMKDLLTDDNSLRLMHCKPIQASNECFFPQADWEWYEPDMEEILTHLEWCYAKRSEARALGLAASTFIHAERTWEIHVNQLKQWLKTDIGLA